MKAHQSGSDPEGAAPSAPSPMCLGAILAELRRLAIGALDGGHPLVAAQIAATADRVEVASLASRPPRPGYAARRSNRG